MLHPICEQCGERPAVVFITKMVENHTTKHRFCEVCAREKALGEGWLSELIEQWGEGEDLPEEMKEALLNAPIDEIMMSMFEDSFESESDFESSDPFETEESDDDFESSDPFSGPAPYEPNYNSNEEFEDPFEDDGYLPLPSFSDSSTSQRCPHCHTTWDRIKQDGRAGCAACYEAFREQLNGVMHRVQRGEHHIGKGPRAAEKRRRRLEHLRQRRDHQLVLLQNRLKEAVSTEKYEEAAKLRDKIKIVSSSILSD